MERPSIFIKPLETSHGVTMRKILIIGANSGIAEAVARIMARQGCALYLLGRNREKLETLASDLLIRGAPHVLTNSFEALDLDTHSELLDKARVEFGDFDAALLAHGFLPEQDRCQNDFSCTHSAYTINILSPIAFLTWLANHFESQKNGNIAVITSVAGDRGRQSNYIYGSAKGGLSIFLQGLRNRLFSHGVTVTDIKPGFVNTAMTRHLAQGALFVEPELIAEGIVKAMKRGTPVVYLPRFWRIIMLAIKLLPGFIFNRLKL